jgi:hypothetical protein
MSPVLEDIPQRKMLLFGGSALKNIVLTVHKEAYEEHNVDI